MNIYYDKDANLDLIREKQIAVIGYGSQGFAQANNLKDSGCNVTVGLRKGSASWEKAEHAGLKVLAVAEAAAEADIVMMLVPDALAPGGWRDYLTLLHPPYTLWHLSYVCIGWAAAPGRHVDRLVATLVAFALAVGIGAHALDEKNGHPLRTRIPDGTLTALAVVSVACACAIGIAGAARVSWWLLPFVAAGGFVVFAYNLELFGGRFHNDAWFAVAWGAFPSLTASYANGTRITLAIVLAACACFALSVAQRTLSTPVRALRRRTRSVQGLVERSDGTTETIDAAYLRAVPESALRALSLAVPLVAGAMVAARF